MSFMGSFQCMFDETMFELIAQITNEYFSNAREKFARERDARSTNVKEIKAYLGVLILIGIQKSNHTNFLDIWSDDKFGSDYVRSVMSGNRFLFLSRCLRFDDRETRAARREIDKLVAIRVFFDKFVSNCKDCYMPNENVTIDESMLLFRGRCAFRMYMPAKPCRYGLKLYSLVDSQNYYLVNCEVYLGKQQGQNPTNNSPTAVVLRLIQPISGTGRNLTTDNWYTSITLAHK